jgi:hypothetical protein
MSGRAVMAIEAILIVSLLLAVLVRICWRLVRDLLIIASVACIFIGVMTLVIGLSATGGGLPN